MTDNAPITNTNCTELRCKVRLVGGDRCVHWRKLKAQRPLRREKKKKYNKNLFHKFLLYFLFRGAPPGLMGSETIKIYFINFYCIFFAVRRRGGCPLKFTLMDRCVRPGGSAAPARADPPVRPYQAIYNLKRHARYKNRINKNYFIFFVYSILFWFALGRIIVSGILSTDAVRGARRVPAPLPDADGVRRVRDLVLDPAQWCAWRAGQDLHLTRTEFALLWALAATPGQPCSRRQLSRQVWGSPDTGNTNLVAVCIRRLRRKLEPDPEHPRRILTERGLGYRFRAEG